MLYSKKASTHTQKQSSNLFVLDDRMMRPPVIPPEQAKKKPINYLDLLRCGGRSSMIKAKKKKEKPKAKYRSLVFSKAM